MAGRPDRDGLCTGLAPVRTTLGFLLGDTSRLMRRRFVQRAREEGLPLNRSEAAVLLYVSHAEGINQATLAAQLDIQPITLARLITRLAAVRLIERRARPGDRRVRTLWLTEESGPMLARIRAITQGVREEALAGFPDERRAAFTEGLLQIWTNLARAQARRCKPGREPLDDAAE